MKHNKTQTKYILQMYITFINLYLYCIICVVYYFH